MEVNTRNTRNKSRIIINFKTLIKIAKRVDKFDMFGNKRSKGNKEIYRHLY